MKLRWLGACLPAGLGLMVALLTQGGWLDNPIVYIRADVGTLALLAGLILSGLVSVFLLWEVRAGRRFSHRLGQMRTEMADERRRFLRRLDHELKNPLTAIRAGLANVSDDAGSSGEREALASVEAQVLRLSRLTADLRKLAELETRTLERTRIEVSELLEEAVSLAREQPGAEGRRLALTLPQAPWPLPAILADRDLVLLAVFNLLNNAIKFSESGDAVEVRALEDGATVVIEVADTGPGIPEEELAHVWEELYRGRGARGVPGSGLGLALVKSIVQRHDGQVTLRSRVHQGTVVTVRLPVE